MAKSIHLLIGLGVVFILFLWLGCGQGTTPGPAQPAATAPPKGTPSGAATDWQKKWEATLAAAKREGPVMIYGDVTPELRKEIVGGFENKYGLKLEFIIGKGAEISVRWEREHAAGINAADIYFTGGGTSILGMKPRGAFAPIEPHFILPEVTDPNGWPGGKVIFLDKEKMVIPLNAGFTTYTAVNTDLVKEGQIRSYKDLLKPEWKGRVTLYDPGITGAGGGWATFILTDAYGLEGGKEFLRQFAATEPVMTRDARLQVDWISKGKYAVGVGVTHSLVSEFKAMGAPITIVRVIEGGNINPGGGCLEVSPTPPHPNGATILINWLLTREGQAAFARGFGSPPVRSDVKVEGIDPSKVAGPNDKAFYTDDNFYVMQGKAVQIAREIFAPLMR